MLCTSSLVVQFSKISVPLPQRDLVIIPHRSSFVNSFLKVFSTFFEKPCSNGFYAVFCVSHRSACILYYTSIKMSIVFFIKKFTKYELFFILQYGILTHCIKNFPKSVQIDKKDPQQEAFQQADLIVFYHYYIVMSGTQEFPPSVAMPFFPHTPHQPTDWWELRSNPTS